MEPKAPKKPCKSENVWRCQSDFDWYTAEFSNLENVEIHLDRQNHHVTNVRNMWQETIQRQFGRDSW